MSDLWLISHLLLWVLALVEGVLLIAVMRQVGTLLIRVGSVKSLDVGGGTAIGEQAPWMPEVTDTRSRLLVFVSTTCATCDSLVPALNAVSKSYGSRIEAVVIGKEDDASLEDWASSRRLRVRAVSAEPAFSFFEVDATPYAYVINPHGVVMASGGVNHVEHLESLIRQCGVLDQIPAATDGSSEGDSLPLLELKGV